MLRKTIIFYSILLFCIYGCNINVFCQAARSLVVEGDKQFADGNYFGALFLYESALQEFPKMPLLRYRYAESCRLAQSYDRALDAYLKLIRANEAQFPQAVYQCASVFKIQGFYGEALRRFRYFYKQFPEDSLAESAKNQILQCEWADKNHVKYDSSVVVTLQFDSATTPFYAYGAVRTLSGLLYSAINMRDSSAQYSSVYATDSSVKIRALVDVVRKTAADVADIRLTTDENEAFFSVCSLVGAMRRCRIFSTRYRDGEWALPRALPDLINYPNSSTTQADVVPWGDSLVLFYSSNRPGGQGQMDIWYAIRYQDVFIDVKNAGQGVNTPYDELAPQYVASDSVLYFSSLGHNGLGGYDVFKSHGTPRHLSTPQNLFAPINSSYDDLYYHVDGNQAYLTSNRQMLQYDGIGVNFNHIYAVALPRVIKESSKSNAVTVDLSVVQVYFDVSQPSDGCDTVSYEQLMYNFLKQKDFYLKKSKQKADQLSARYSKAELENFFVNDIELGFERLKRLSVYLASRPESHIVQIVAYTSPEGDSVHNLQLALRRAECIKRWIASRQGQKNVPKFKIIIADNRADELLSKNKASYEYNPWITKAFFKRRVEVLIVKDK